MDNHNPPTVGELFRPAARMSYAELVEAVKASPSWHNRIADESGCRRYVLRRMVTSKDYFARADQVEMIQAWFDLNGVPLYHIHTARAAVRRAAAA